MNSQTAFKIVASNDRIYHTNFQNNTVHCLSLTGQNLLVYTNKSIIYPEGLAVTRDQILFVAGKQSNNLAIIYQNGLESKILLTVSDGLVEPSALYYNKDRNEL